MNMKRILALILAALMLAPAFASCDKENPGTPDNPDTPAVSDSESDTDTTAPEQTGLVLAKTDFDGASLRVHGVSPALSYGYYQTNEIWIETESPDPFESAVYKRVQDCINKYNFNIVYDYSEAPLSDIAALVSGGLDQYDVVFGKWSDSYKSAKAGNLLDIKDMVTVDLNNEWWDQNANRELCVANRMFYTTGDISVIDDRCARSLYFNKTLAKNNNLANPYELVRSNQWTFDKFAEMSRAVYQDLNANGETDLGDTLGFFYEAGQFHFLITGLDEHYATLDKDGMPIYSFLQTSEAVTKMETLSKLLIDPKVTYDIARATDYEGFSNRWMYARGMFAAGKQLFTVGGALVITEFADMEDEFGILPMPKWTPEQERYYHIIETPTPMMGIPNTKVDTTDLGYMLEYFSYEGLQTLTPAFKEKMLKRRYAQDADSGDMLDLIYASKCFDVGFVGNWGSVLNIANGALGKGKVPSTTTYNRAVKSVHKLIGDDFDAFAKVGRDVQ